MIPDLTKVSLEKLTGLAQEGQADAERKIIVSMQPEVRKIAENTFSEGQETEDLEQEGLIGLLEAIRDYDLRKNDQFYPFAVLCIKRQIQSAQEKALRKKNQPLNRFVSISDSENSMEESYQNAILDNSENPEQIFLDRTISPELYKKLWDLLSAYERQVLFLKAQGYSIKDLSKILDRSEKSIENALHRIRIKMSKY